MGNPLLDISAQVDQELLDQFEVRGRAATRRVRDVR